MELRQPLAPLAKAAFIAVVVVPLALVVWKADDVGSPEVGIGGAIELTDGQLSLQTVCLPPERLRPSILETEQTVIVTMTALDYDPDNSDGCSRSKTVSLTSPLGERSLIDGSSGSEVQVARR